MTNRSSAVMQQRKEPHNSLDDFPTPPWATRALFEFLSSQGFTAGGSGRDPAANRGHLVRVLQERFDHVDAADVHDYGAGFRVEDYLFGPDPDAVDWTITNPPFRLAEQFINRALRSSQEGCAFLVRSAFTEGQERYASLFSVNPPAYVLQFSERVVMHKGKVLDPETPIEIWSKKARGFVRRKPSTATAYCWVIFLKDHLSGATELHWVPPCRRRLERPGDYPAGGCGLAVLEE